MERGVLVQRSMSPRHMILGGFTAQDPGQGRFAKRDHVVETFAADRADESLNVSILPGRSGCDRMVPNAHCTDPLQEDWTIRGVSIPNEISRRVVPRERLGDLARDPLRGWVCRHAKRHPKPPSVAHNDKTIQNLECDRRQDKEVDRRDAVDVIAEKRPPALRRWPRVAAHVPSDRRLRDLEAELEQLTMNTRRAPKRVRTAHLANERAQLSRGLRSANTVAGSPAPIRPKPSTVPAHDGLRPDNRNHLKDGRKPAIEPNKYQTIRIVEVRSLRRSPAKHIDLLPQDQVFRFQRCSRLEARSQDTENQLEQIGHQDASLRRPPAASTPNRIFGTHTPVAHELTHVIQQSCSLEAGILQRTCGQNNQQSFYAGAANYCKDTGFTGVLHPGKTCHREIPANPSACPPGDQVCFDADGNCSDSYDEVSTVGSKDASGGCVVNWKCFPGHAANDIIPGLAALTPHLCLTSQSTLDCMKACDSKPWYTRPFCKVGCGAS